MDENSSPSGKDKPEKRESGIAELVNSPAGVTLLGFFLTGVLGALVTFSVNAFQRWDQDRTATLTERENEISSVNKQFVGAIVQRTFYTDAVLGAIDQSKVGADLDAAWPHYESAYQAELAAVWQNHLNIEGHLEDDPAPTGQNGWQPFWYYLDVVIQPRFQEMDHCLRAAHGAYLSVPGAQAERIKAAQRILQECETSYHWDHLGKAQKASVAIWDHFETCLESFTYHLDVSARIERQVSKAAETSVSLPDPASCDKGDPICLQARFLVGLEGSLAEDCGPLPAGERD
ncbi:MAG TPA: hypothetical protein VHY79_09450 [Rhizomicrobium sp.]|jgi:hypothetical protein|nr:hypothetical protein [Rhizomicrobium sp.]